MSASSRAAFAVRMPTASVAYRISEFPGEGRAAPSRIISRFTLKFASAEIMRAAMTAASRGVPSATSVKSAAASIRNPANEETRNPMSGAYISAESRTGRKWLVGLPGSYTFTMGTCTRLTPARVARSSMVNSYSYLSPGMFSAHSIICGVKPRSPVWVSASRVPVARAKNPMVRALPTFERAGTVPLPWAVLSGRVRTPSTSECLPLSAWVAVCAPTRRISRTRCWPSASAVTTTCRG